MTADPSVHTGRRVVEVDNNDTCIVKCESYCSTGISCASVEHSLEIISNLVPDFWTGVTLVDFHLLVITRVSLEPIWRELEDLGSFRLGRYTVWAVCKISRVIGKCCGWADIQTISSTRGEAPEAVKVKIWTNRAARTIKLMTMVVE